MKTITTVHGSYYCHSSPCRVYSIGARGGGPGLEGWEQTTQYLEEEGRALQSIVIIGMTSIGWVPFKLAFALLEASKLKRTTEISRICLV